MATLPERVGVDISIKDVEIPTNTFIIDWSARRIAGMDEGLKAMRQAVEIILNTERYCWQIYSSDFGSELEELTGEEFDYIVSEIPRRIEEALSIDSRVLSVQNFVFKDNRDSTMSCSFDVITVYGTVTDEVII